MTNKKPTIYDKEAYPEFMEALAEAEKAFRTYVKKLHFSNKIHKLCNDLDKTAEQLFEMFGCDEMEELPSTLRSAEQELSEYSRQALQETNEALKKHRAAFEKRDALQAEAEAHLASTLET